ncbi:MAG: hypothetical protein QOF68_634 [Gaiellales bacterium]|jgi:uncharacterized paraquat-inducible protein A|nr:hypothetical protein [Gaiellales bacterium]
MAKRFCANCGAPLAEGAGFCPSCGIGVEAAPRPSSQRTSGNAIASLVLGIAGFVFIPLIPSIIAIVLGNKAKEEMARDPAVGGDGFATAGVVLGWIGVGLCVFGLALLLLIVVAGSWST